ncbi:septal ring lytic transglycosylase RlpA family lipoprotein [candidate division LCP-89 bacterium B3_LCP]|uniref:Probable endolytic peptidoglycan transglycosylase RlpA n=1 Tax=candidate division LCP-89 bacterium B3_LCP TaxID=2012998 RepID=A0A532UZA5_UNCL8|nr:MAG: septal ring lytic transglycosylase RlpA family lipoprotein [candidate division LCP-89 bacterium B3_LCP]
MNFIRYSKRTFVTTFPACLIVLFVTLSFWGCTSMPRYRSGPVSPVVEPGSRYVETGIASYYADKFHGRPTSSGEIFDMNGISAAHKTLPLGTVVKVKNLDNGKSLNVRINDRGPFVKGRIIDLSLGAAQVIDMVVAGTARVRIEVIEWGTGKGAN